MKIEDKSSGINYLIRRLAGVVFMFVVRIQLDVPAHWKQATDVECRGAQFIVFAFVENFGTSIRRWMVGANGDATFESQPIAVTPSEIPTGPI